MAEKLYENLPLIIFWTVFLISLIVLIIGAIISFSAKDTVKLSKGRKILIMSAYSFSILLLIAIVFSSVTWILNKNVEDNSELDPNAFPTSPVDPNFPSPPSFIKISDTYFNGPFPFSEYSIISEPAIFSILCQNEEEYDIIDIDTASVDTDLTLYDNADCWSSVCEDLKIGIFWVPESNVVGSRNKTDILENLKEQNNLICPTEE